MNFVCTLLYGVDRSFEIAMWQNHRKCAGDERRRGDYRGSVHTDWSTHSFKGIDSEFLQLWLCDLWLLGAFRCHMDLKQFQSHRVLISQVNPNRLNFVERSDRQTGVVKSLHCSTTRSRIRVQLQRIWKYSTEGTKTQRKDIVIIQLRNSQHPSSIPRLPEALQIHISVSLLNSLLFSQ